MPTSFYDHIPLVCSVVAQYAPQSVLDVGVGFGKWGHLFRELVDIFASDSDPARYQRPNWRGRVDGIEGFAPYVTDMHRFLYDQIHVGDMREVIKTLGSYDVVFMGDVIEHVDKESGTALLRDALARANKALIVSTPAYDIEQHDVCGNPLEDHRSFWTPADFRRVDAGVTIRRVGCQILLAIFTKPGVPKPRLPRPVTSAVRDSVIRVIGMKRYRRLRGLK
jgi:hypothetical protein